MYVQCTCAAYIARKCIQIILGVYTDYTGDVYRLYWGCIQIILGVYTDYTGGVYWDAIMSKQIQLTMLHRHHTFVTISFRA